MNNGDRVYVFEGPGDLAQLVSHLLTESLADLFVEQLLFEKSDKKNYDKSRFFGKNE